MPCPLLLAIAGKNARSLAQPAVSDEPRVLAESIQRPIRRHAAPPRRVDSSARPRCHARKTERKQLYAETLRLARSNFISHFRKASCVLAPVTLLGLVAGCSSDRSVDERVAKLLGRSHEQVRGQPPVPPPRQRTEMGSSPAWWNAKDPKTTNPAPEELRYPAADERRDVAARLDSFGSAFGAEIGPDGELVKPAVEGLVVLTLADSLRQAQRTGREYLRARKSTSCRRSGCCRSGTCGGRGSSTTRRSGFPAAVKKATSTTRCGSSTRCVRRSGCPTAARSRRRGCSTRRSNCARRWAGGTSRVRPSRCRGGCAAAGRGAGGAGVAHPGGARPDLSGAGL